MHRELDKSFDDSQPALIVTYGSTPGRYRPLFRDVVVVGQGRGADVRLAAPEIAEVHCLLLRGPGGWRVRDCGSRVGTRVNGKMVHEEALCDDDVLQVGTFTFRAHLPEPPAGEPAVNPRECQLQRSRKRLGRLALRLRRQLREEQAARSTGAAEQELARQAEALRERLRDCDQWALRQQEAERDLARDRAALDREAAAFREHVARIEAQLRQKGAEATCDSAIF